MDEKELDAQQTPADCRSGRQRTKTGGRIERRQATEREESATNRNQPPFDSLGIWCRRVGLRGNKLGAMYLSMGMMTVSTFFPAPSPDVSTDTSLRVPSAASCTSCSYGHPIHHAAVGGYSVKKGPVSERKSVGMYVCTEAHENESLLRLVGDAVHTKYHTPLHEWKFYNALPGCRAQLQ